MEKVRPGEHFECESRQRLQQLLGDKTLPARWQIAPAAQEQAILHGRLDIHCGLGSKHYEGRWPPPKRNLHKSRPPACPGGLVSREDPSGDRARAKYAEGALPTQAGLRGCDHTAEDSLQNKETRARGHE